VFEKSQIDSKFGQNLASLIKKWKFNQDSAYPSPSLLFMLALHDAVEEIGVSHNDHSKLLSEVDFLHTKIIHLFVIHLLYLK